jgi:hypothetical protein
LVDRNTVWSCPVVYPLCTYDAVLGCRKRAYSRSSHRSGRTLHHNHKSSTLVLLHLLGIISFLFDRSGSTSLFFRGGNHTLARPGLFMSSFPIRRMFNSKTTTRRKSLFSLGSRCLIAGSICENKAPFSDPAFPLLLFLLRLREYVCICIIGVGSSSVGCARACWNWDE